MFTSVRVYSVNALNELLKSIDIEEQQRNAEAMLKEFAFTPCSAQEVKRVGFTAPFKEHHEAMLYSAGNYMVGAVKFQEKKVPTSFVNDSVSNKASEYLQANGEKPSRKQRNAWKEEITTSILPNIIPVSKVVRFCLDVKSSLILVDTATSSKAEDVLALLRKAFGSLPALPYFDANKLNELLQEFGKNTGLPESITLGSKIRFEAPDEEKATSNFKNVDIMAADVQSQFEDKFCTQIELQKPDTVTFTLKDDGSVAQLKFADEIFEDKEEDALPGRIIITFDTLHAVLGSIGARPEQ